MSSISAMMYALIKQKSKEADESKEDEDSSRENNYEQR